MSLSFARFAPPAPPSFRPRNRWQALTRLGPLLLGLLVLCPGTCLAGVATADSLRPVYSAGHGDIGVSFQDNMLHLGLHLHSGAVVDGVPLATDAEYEPSEISIQVASSFLMPESDLALDLGITPGTTVYILADLDPGETPFLGFSTEELNSADWSGDIRWLVNGLSGPGDFFMVGFSALEPNTYIGLQSDFYLPIPTHKHYLMLFTAPGTYEVTYNVSGTLVDGGPGGINLRAVQGTFVFEVGSVPEPSLTVTLGSLAALGLVFRKRLSRLASPPRL